MKKIPYKIVAFEGDIRFQQLQGGGEKRPGEIFIKMKILLHNVYYVA